MRPQFFLKFSIVLVAVATLSACSHNLYLVGRTSGEMGTGLVQRAPGAKSGNLSIALGEKSYSGRWIYVGAGGVSGFSNAYATSGTSFGTGSGTFIGGATHGVGTILASSPDGATLRCEFQFDGMGNTGLGVCYGGNNEVFDLQIN